MKLTQMVFFGGKEGGGDWGAGGRGWVKVTLVSYIYIYSYDALKLYYVKFVYENDTLMRN